MGLEAKRERMRDGKEEGMCGPEGQMKVERDLGRTDGRETWQWMVLSWPGCEERWVWKDGYEMWKGLRRREMMEVRKARKERLEGWRRKRWQWNAGGGGEERWWYAGEGGWWWGGGWQWCWRRSRWMASGWRWFAIEGDVAGRRLAEAAGRR